MKKFKIIEDLTSDVMFEAYGNSLKEVFENSALALSSIICQIDKVKPKKSKTIKISAKDPASLMFSFLQEIIALVDIEQMFFSKFQILKINKNSLEASVYGEEIKPEIGETVVKAITNYKYKFEKTKNNYKVRVVLDI